MTEPTEYLYSTDDEEYVYTSLTECLESIYVRGVDYENFETFTVFKAKVVPLDIDSMCYHLAVETIYNCENYVYGRVGESYNSNKSKSHESRVMLQAVIEQWVHQHTNAPTYKEIIGETEELIFTSDEVRELLNA